MPLSFRVDELVELPNGRVEARVTVLVNGKPVATDSVVIPDADKLSVAQAEGIIGDFVKGHKPKYQTRDTLSGLKGRTVVVEP